MNQEAQSRLLRPDYLFLNSRENRVRLVEAVERHLISYEKGIKLKLSGNEVYYTAWSSPVILKNLCSKLRCQRVLMQFPFHMIFAHTFGPAGVPRS